MATPWICNSRDWPLVRLELPAGVDPRDVDQESFYREVDALLARGERFASLHDLRYAERLDAGRRKRFADWLKSRHDELRRTVIAHAPLVGSALQRGAITALMWIVEPPCETKVFTDRPDAEAWLRQRLEAERARR